MGLTGIMLAKLISEEADNCLLQVEDLKVLLYESNLVFVFLCYAMFVFIMCAGVLSAL